MTLADTTKVRTLPLSCRLSYLQVRLKKKIKTAFSDPCYLVGPENLYPPQQPASVPLSFPCGKPASH